MNTTRISFAKGMFTAALAVALVVLLAAAGHAQKLATYTNPPTGLAGVNNSYITGSGFPAGTITGATVSFAATCGGAVITTTPVTAVAVETPFRRFEFAIPASLKTGTYFVTVSGTAGSTAFNTASGPSCSEISVTATTTTLAACVPTSSLGISAPSSGNVDAYVPNASWDYDEGTGISRVPLEGTDTATTISTPGYVNSCAANSGTGEIVCTENNTNVDLINGTTVTTLTSGSNTDATFTGGDCENCGVAVNAANNTAIIAMGVIGGSGDPYGGASGVQVLNLATNTFDTPVPLTHVVSEDISIDSSRNLVLSPGEEGYYDLLTLNSSTGAISGEYGNYVGPLGGGYTLDSAAEDCTTGIALSASEFTDYIYITDLTQATFTSGTPGTWTAPTQILAVGYPAYDTGGSAIDGDSFAAGTSGITVAPGTGHLAIVTGEFGGQSYSVLALPSTSGSGTPTLVDYAYVLTMPSSPDGGSFEAGADPHTVAAYTSPTSGKSYAVLADWEDGYYAAPPTYVARIDLACVLALPRTSDGHTVSGSTSSCTTYYKLP